MYRPSPHVRMNDKFETNVHRENIIAKRSRVLARFYRLTAAEYGTKVQQGLWAVRERSWDHLERRLETIEDEETMDMNEQNFLEAWHRRLDFVEQFRGSDGEYRPEYAMEMVKFWNKNKPHTLPRMSLFTLELFVPEKLGETLRDIKRRSDWEWEMVDKRSLNFTHVDYGRLMASIAQFSPMEMDPTPPHVQRSIATAQKDPQDREADSDLASTKETRMCDQTMEDGDYLTVNSTGEVEEVGVVDVIGNSF